MSERYTLFSSCSYVLIFHYENVNVLFTYVYISICVTKLHQ